jgi:hypothetical protein
MEETPVEGFIVEPGEGKSNHSHKLYITGDLLNLTPRVGLQDFKDE